MDKASALLIELSVTPDTSLTQECGNVGRVKEIAEPLAQVTQSVKDGLT